LKKSRVRDRLVGIADLSIAGLESEPVQKHTYNANRALCVMAGFLAIHSNAISKDRDLSF
jgi:hypothetical protein